MLYGNEVNQNNSRTVYQYLAAAAAAAAVGVFRWTLATEKPWKDKYLIS